ncbi:hypothetical protein MKW94_007401 [Papaver nudicaule]|uniref:Pentatricopeptide repeat-containing protein n=1 Tax=Papaver nudicaule TaxID=74823 RepID=A0AA41VKM6_PAPNU|nr:hypothetical protein [Papaver nudicaule]
MYIKCGSICSASLVFDKISEREDTLHDITLWNPIIDGYFRYGIPMIGFVQFRRMQSLGVRPDAYSISNAYSISIVLRTDIFDLLRGKEIHGYLLKNIYDHDHFLDTALIDMYTKCGRIIRATVTWNSIVSRFHRNGLWDERLEYFVLMKSRGCKLESSAFSIVLTACSDGEDVVFGSEVHCDLIKLGFEKDPYVSTSLLTLYSKSGLVNAAQTVFDQNSSNKGIELWNGMISAYVGNGYVYKALDVYLRMRLSGLTCLMRLEIQSDTQVENALLDMYIKCGSLKCAQSIFENMGDRSIVTWNSMISGYGSHGDCLRALKLFEEMQRLGVVPDDITFLVLISSCSHSGLFCNS